MANENKNQYVLIAAGAVVLAVAAIGGLNALGFATLQTGTAQANVLSSVAITLTTTTVNFGDMFVTDTNSTSDDMPLPFELRNDGNVKVNVTINATDLWVLSANPTADYQFAANTSSEGTCYDPSSTTALTNMPASATPTGFLTYLNYTNSCDTAQIELSVTVPGTETTGAKSSTVTFIASQA